MVAIAENLIEENLTSGDVVEHYKYDPYGKVEIFTGAGVDGVWFTADDVTSTASAVGNPYYYTGRRLDDETGLLYFRNRYYSATLGRFISRDALEYVDGWNLYRGYFAVNGVDALGLDAVYILVFHWNDESEMKNSTFDKIAEKKEAQYAAKAKGEKLKKRTVGTKEKNENFENIQKGISDWWDTIKDDLYCGEDDDKKKCGDKNEKKAIETIKIIIITHGMKDEGARIPTEGGPDTRTLGKDIYQWKDFGPIKGLLPKGILDSKCPLEIILYACYSATTPRPPRGTMKGFKGTMDVEIDGKGNITIKDDPDQ